jgi:hypothetical protein
MPMIENLNSCFLYRNSSIQTLTIISLYFSQNELINNRNKKNYNFQERLNKNRVILKKEIFLLNNRVFNVMSNIETLFFTFNLKHFTNFKDFKKNPMTKMDFSKSKNFYPKIIEKLLCQKIITQDFSYIEEKKLELIELSCEIKKNFLILNLFGVIDFNEVINDFNFMMSKLGIEIENISFHLFRKIKNKKFIFLLENNDKILLKMIRVFRDKSIKGNNLNEFFTCLLDDHLSILKHWGNSIKMNMVFFFKWVKNFFQFKNGIIIILNNVSFLQMSEKIRSEPEEKISFFTSDFISLKKLQRMGKILKNSNKFQDFFAFVSYGEIISSLLEFKKNDDKNFSGEKYTNEIENGSYFNTKNPIFKIIGFIYFQEILKGMINLKKHLEHFKIAPNSLGFEQKILFAIGMISHKSYSEKILNLIIKRLEKNDFKKVLSFGNYMIFKNLAHLCLALTFCSTNFIKMEHNIKLKNLEVFYVKWIKYKFQKKKIISQILFPRNLKKKMIFDFKNKLLVIFLMSLCIVQNQCIIKPYFKFLSETVHLINLLGSFSILNREQDILLKFLPLIFGVQMIGKKRDINLFIQNFIWDTKTEIIKFPFTSHNNISKKNFKWDRITLQLSRNNFLQQICLRMMQYCAFMGTTKKELVKMAIKDIKLFESIRIKKIDRIFIIQEKYKKNSISPIFFSIYDLNIFNELDRSFIYFKTSIDISILGLCLLILGNDFMSKLIYRIQSFFLSCDYIQYSSCALISISFLYVSNTECPASDFIIKLLGSTDFVTIKNSIFSIGLIGSGTNNMRIKNALKSLANFYKLKLENSPFRKRSLNSEDDFQFFRKINSIFFLIRLSQGMINSFYRNLSQINPLSGKVNKISIGYLLFTLFSFMISNFIGEESIFTCFFLLNGSLNSKLICTFDENFRIRCLKIKNQKSKNAVSTHLFTPCFILN